MWLTDIVSLERHTRKAPDRHLPQAPRDPFEPDTLQACFFLVLGLQEPFAPRKYHRPQRLHHPAAAGIIPGIVHLEGLPGGLRGCLLRTLLRLHLMDTMRPLSTWCVLPAGARGEACCSGSCCAAHSSSLNPISPGSRHAPCLQAPVASLGCCTLGRGRCRLSCFASLRSSLKQATLGSFSVLHLQMQAASPAPRRGLDAGCALSLPCCPQIMTAWLQSSALPAGASGQPGQCHLGPTQGLQRWNRRAPQTAAV